MSNDSKKIKGVKPQGKPRTHTPPQPMLGRSSHGLEGGEIFNPLLAPRLGSVPQAAIETHFSRSTSPRTPLAVAVGIITSGDEILLIQRKRNDYVGFWSLPGGKIENDEDSAQAILRELLEETGIAGTVTRYAGLVSEILRAEDDAQSKHFLLHVHEVRAHGKDIVQSDDEGTAAWFPISDLDLHKEKIIPSDYLMILNMSGKPESIFDCLVEKIGDNHTLKYFKKR